MFVTLGPVCLYKVRFVQPKSNVSYNTEHIIEKGYKIGVSISYAKYLKNNFLLLPVFKTFLSSQFTFRTLCVDYFSIQQVSTNTNEDLELLAVTARKKKTYNQMANL